MRNVESLTSSEITDFLKASGGIEFAGKSRAEVYRRIEQTSGQPGIRPAGEEGAGGNPGVPETGEESATA